MKRSAAVILSGLLLLPFALAGNTSAASVTIGGSKAQVVTVDMLLDYTIDVVTAYNGVQSDEKAQDLISRAAADGKSTVIAAINGGFFNSYYDANKAIAFPSNYPQNLAAIVQNGQLVNIGGEQNVFGFTYDGKAMVDRVKMNVELNFRGTYARISPWDVNRYDTNSASRISLITPKFILPFTTQAGSAVITIRNNSVTDISDGGKQITAPKDALLLIIHSGALAEIKKQNKMPRLGDTVDVRYNYTPKKEANATAWANMKTIAEGGRMLVWNGKNVAKDTAFNAKFDSDSKQSATGKAQRSFIGVTSAGKVVMGTVASASFVDIADYLIGLGVTDAVNMDGGASSMLYASGSFQTSPGRKLATALVVVKRSVKETKPAAYVDQPSSWAKEAVGSIGSWLPAELNCGYQSNITRYEYTRVITDFMQKATGDKIEVIVAKNNTSANVTFSDVDAYFISACAALKVVSGTGDGNKFEPDRFLTRQEAIVMVCNALRVIGRDTSDTGGVALTFQDTASIQSWAVEMIRYAVSCGLVDGKAERFSPYRYLTREMAFVVAYNALNLE